MIIFLSFVADRADDMGWPQDSIDPDQGDGDAERIHAGRSKTIRGILLSALVTTASAPLIGLDLSVGAIAAAAAMLGDLCSSFVKRRSKFPPSSQTLGLDQLPESLFPLLACRAALSPTAADTCSASGYS